MLVVSLSSIPPRFGKLYQTLDSLKRQEGVSKIELWLPKKYRRFPDYTADNFVVPDGVVLRQCDYDLGPATKILPAAFHYRGSQARILYCDDDKIFPTGWANSFIAASKNFERCAIAAIGNWIDQYEGGVSRIPKHERARRQRTAFDLEYRFKKIKRRLHSAIWQKQFVKPTPSRWFKRSGFIDIMEGYGGVLIHPDFFLDNDARIPDPIWRVDDIWLSGLMAARNVSIIGSHLSPMPISQEEVTDALNEDNSIPYSRRELETAAIKYFQATHGVWL